MSANPTICAPPAAYYGAADLMEIFKNGLASERLVPDSSTGRIPSAAIASHVEGLYQANVLKRRPTLDVAENQVETNMSELVKYDAELFQRLNAEYCHYEQRYRYALTQFLKLATSRNHADNTNAQAMLENTKILNLRVNSLLEIMNYMASTRVGEVNNNKTAINNYNEKINEKLDKLRKSYGFLSQENVIVKTQQESVRYTQEKNAYTSNQIAVWAALNVVALGVIFYVYRN